MEGSGSSSCGDGIPLYEYVYCVYNGEALVSIDSHLYFVV